MRIGLLVGVFAVGLVGERFFPLRRVTTSKSRRVFRNLGISAVSATALQLVFFPGVLWLSRSVGESQGGLLGALRLDPRIKIALGILLFDYSLYLWHRLNHVLPFLWRFHNVHQVDLDMDVSTASRFHFGELILSTGYRSLQVVLIGADPFTLLLFEILVITAAQFHHSNLRLPLGFERGLGRILVTPRMHGIHHSIVRDETDSNWSTIFPFWDRLHGTLRLGVAQGEITIGVPSYREDREVSFFRLLLLPFGKQRPWKLPDGSVPERVAFADARTLSA